MYRIELRQHGPLKGYSSVQRFAYLRPDRFIKGFPRVNISDNKPVTAIANCKRKCTGSGHRANKSPRTFNDIFGISVAKQKFKIINWHIYNKALINRDSLTFSLDDEAVQARYESATPSSRGRPQRYSDLAITTGLKVFGEGEWNVKKHGKERRRTWRKLHLAVDADTHKIICTDLSLNNVTDSEAFPGLIRQTHSKIRAVADQRLTGSNVRWKWTTDYNRHSIAETAMDAT